MKTITHFLSYLAHFFSEREMFKTRVVEKSKHDFAFSNLFVFFENPAVCEIIWKNIVELDKATDDDVAHAQRTLDT